MCRKSTPSRLAILIIHGKCSIWKYRKDIETLLLHRASGNAFRIHSGFGLLISSSSLAASCRSSNLHLVYRLPAQKSGPVGYG